MSKDALRKYFRYESDGSFTRLRRSGNALKGTRTYGTLHHKGYRWIRFLGKTYAFHRLVWAWHYGNTSKSIDHINRNRQDNRIENLRLVTKSQNSMNAKLSKKNTSGVRGVFFIKKEKSWSASIMFKGKRIKLGQTKDRAIAEALYTGAAKALFGDFYVS